jgi:DNA-damage-inducible protein D
VQSEQNQNPFERIRRVNDEGIEYWSARDLSKLLGYARYGKFVPVIEKATQACANSGQIVADHFAHIRQMVNIGKGAQRAVDDVELSRYACYLVVQNADPAKEIVALGQTYFAVQTRRSERVDEMLAAMSEEQRRLFLHNQLTIQNRALAQTVTQAGIVQPEDFAIFQDHGYMGLYGGLRANDIADRKGLNAENSDIIDYMGSEELANNIFRAVQANSKLRRDAITDKDTANRSHQAIGQEVRYTIERIGGTLPEDLPTPATSIQELQAPRNARPELLDKSAKKKKLSD